MSNTSKKGATPAPAKKTKEAPKKDAKKATTAPPATAPKKAPAKKKPAKLKEFHSHTEYGRHWLMRNNSKQAVFTTEKACATAVKESNRLLNLKDPSRLPAYLNTLPRK